MSSAYPSPQPSGTLVVPRPVPYRIDAAFIDIVTKLRTHWPELAVVDEDARYVRDFVRRFGRNPDIALDYERYAMGFNKAFFFKNLYKALFVLWNNRSRIPLNLPLVDVGCGAGVFTIAWISLFNADPNRFVLIDSSQSQLLIAERVLSILGYQDVQLRRGAYPGEFADVTGLRLYSYFFCKQQITGDSLVTRNALAAWLGSNAIVIDYDYVLDDLQRRLSGRYISEKSVQLLSPPTGCERLFNDSYFYACALLFSQSLPEFVPSEDQL